MYYLHLLRSKKMFVYFCPKSVNTYYFFKKFVSIFCTILIRKMKMRLISMKCCIFILFTINILDWTKNNFEWINNNVKKQQRRLKLRNTVTLVILTRKNTNTTFKYMYMFWITSVPAPIHSHIFCPYVLRLI